MILNITIRNFRSYKDEIVFSMEPNSSKSKSSNIFHNGEYKILKSALIYGPNASGKSNIVRAFFEILKLIKYKPKVGREISLNDPFLFDDKNLNSPIYFNLEFVLNKIKYQYEIILKDNIILKEELNWYPKKYPQNLFKRNEYNENETIQYGVIGEFLGGKKISVFPNQLLMSKFGDDEPLEILTDVFLYFDNLYVYNATSKLHYDLLKNNVSSELSKDPNLKSKLEKLINAIDTKIVGIEINEKDIDLDEEISRYTKENFDVYGLHNFYSNEKIVDKRPLNLKEESVGTQNLYALGTKIFKTIIEGGVLIVDELDTSLHPYVTKMILMIFLDEEINSKGAQIIFTTHDVTLLDKDIVRKDQIWISEKNIDGSTDLFSLQDFEGLREDTAFDKWYLSGKFGGIPQIKSLKEVFNNEIS
ncbi:ATP/GTP-binding protein [Empedobacter sp.]|uniref:AAA family ATPase n=1 Tax=unclassified Empedobacter TaxID=2643773 RepID=UPI0025BC5CE4|nr:MULTISPECIES: ATP-binding protein [unclassified Empedobacter]